MAKADPGLFKCSQRRKRTAERTTPVLFRFSLLWRLSLLTLALAMKPGVQRVKAGVKLFNLFSCSNDDVAVSRVSIVLSGGVTTSTRRDLLCPQSPEFGPVGSRGVNSCKILSLRSRISNLVTTNNLTGDVDTSSTMFPQILQ